MPARPSGKRSGSERIYRILDANLNRCREGLRVLEDTARFVWDDRRFFEGFRRERHGIDRLARHLYGDLVRARASREDRGRKIPESGRAGVRGVVAANFKRCEESLRVLEEYSKIFSAGAGSSFKKVRFRIYSLEKKVMGNGVLYER